MARNYPKYLFSNPQNTKSKGPFVIHLLKPRMICKIHERRHMSYIASDHPNALNFGRFAIELIEAWDEVPSSQYATVLRLVNEWLWKQIESGEIDLPETPINELD